MKKISGSGFKSEDKIDVMIDRLEEIITETEKIRLAENLRYTMSWQFLERLENCGKINAVERMKLKDVIEDVNGNPKGGDTMEFMKKELRKIKVVENCEEPFKKENTTYYVRNNENNRSRMDNWKSKGFVRSDSHPRFFRMASKNTYVRDNSKFSRQGSNLGDNLRPEINYR